MTDETSSSTLRDLEQRLQDAGTPTALEQDAIEYAAQLEDEVEHTRNWYSVRIERLRVLCEEHGLLDEFGAIVANGTATPEEQPTYAQRINTLEHERDEARAERDRLHTQLVWVCSQYEATWRVVREEGGTPPSVAGAREALREVERGDTIERIQRDGHLTGAYNMLQEIIRITDGRLWDIIGDEDIDAIRALAEGDDREGDDD